MEFTDVILRNKSLVAREQDIARHDNSSQVVFLDELLIVPLITFETVHGNHTRAAFSFTTALIKITLLISPDIWAAHPKRYPMWTHIILLT